MTTAPRFGLLGPLRVLDAAGSPLDLGGLRQRSLLAVLLLEPGRVIPVDRLVALMWGDHPPAKPLANLQSYVSHLRRVLEPERADRLAPSILGYRGGGYVADVDPDDIDARCFERAAAGGAAALAEGRWDDAAARLDEGLALWRGPALADVADEPFALGPARRLEDLRIAAREDRLEVDLHRGLSAAVAAQAEEVLAEHPYRERLVCIQLLALYRAGRQADALRAANRFRERLGDELGLDPSPELQRLELDILQQSPDLDVVSSRSAPAGRAGSPPEATGPTPRHEPGAPSALPPEAATGTGGARLVGRTAELEIVDSVVSDVLAGRGRFVTISGEPGIGKTRLAQELAARAVAAGADVHWARCADGEATPSLWPWAQLIRSIATRSGAPLAVAAAPHLTRLAGLVPELLPEGAPPVPETGDGHELSRLWLFDATVAYLRAASTLRPLVLVVDDAQWMDAVSLRMLQAAVIELTGEGAGPRAAVAFVATVRTHDPATDPALPQALAEMARLAGMRRISLHGLHEDAVGEVLADVLGARPEPELVATVAGRSAGNPLFVREIGALVAGDPDEAGRVPTRVRELVARRLRALPPGADRVVVSAAVLGRRFDLPVLEAMLDLTPDEVLDLIDAAVAAGMLREDDTVLGRFHITHDLVRETILTELSAVRRARLHARAFEVLSARPAPPGTLREVELAHHALEAAALIGVERAVDAVTTAELVGTNSGWFAHEDAAVLCRRALAALDPLLDDHSRARLLYALGDTLCRTPEMAEGQRAMDEAMRLARRVGDDDLFALAAIDYGGGALLGVWLDHRVHDPAMITRLREARARQPVGTKLYIELTCRLAIELYATPDRERRVALGDEAVAQGVALGDPFVHAEALICRLLAGWTSADTGDRVDLATRLVEVGDRSDDAFMRAVGRHYRVCGLLEAGEVEEADRLLPDYLELAHECPHRTIVAASSWLQAMFLGLRSRFAEAEQALDAARQATARMRPGGSRGVHVARAVLRYAQGFTDPDTDVSSRPQRGLGDLFARDAARARALVAGGDHAAARAIATQIAPLAATAPDDFTLTTELSIAAELAADLADAELATICRRRLEPLSGRVVVFGAGLACRGAVDHYVGLAALVLGDRAAAEHHLLAGMQMHERLRAPGLVAASQSALARLADGRTQE